MKLKEALECLTHTERHRRLIDRHKTAPDNRSTWYKISFAYRFENRGLPIQYEVSATDRNEKMVDFEYEADGISILFELFRVEQFVEEKCTTPNRLPGSDSISNAGNENQLTASQVIRLQKKILEKPINFSHPNDYTINIVAVDCSEIYCGLVDKEDVRVAMVGIAENPWCQEYWGKPPFQDSDRLIGIFEDAYGFRANGRRRRGVAQFQRNVDGVIFTPKPFEDDGTNGEMISLNPKLGQSRNQYVLNNISSLTPMAFLDLVK